MKLFISSTLFFLVMFFLFDGWRKSDVEKVTDEVTKPAVVLHVNAAGAPAQSLLPTPSTRSPSIDRVDELFRPDSNAFPFVETITYKSRVPWLAGKMAWIVNYATHYKTSKHFISRSLSGHRDYFYQDVKDGDRFNVLSLEAPYHFHLLLNLSERKLWLGAMNETTGEVEWIKNYTACVGREEPARTSGYLTPLGTYGLGDRIAVYTTESKGYYLGEKVEMIRYFGTRWIPFEREIKGCTAPAKSYGIHGVPWIKEGEEWREDCSSIGTASADGCIRLRTEDIEELYAIISSRPTTTTIEITTDYLTAEIKP
jgi:hypothetical protein